MFFVIEVGGEAGITSVSQERQLCVYIFFRFSQDAEGKHPGFKTGFFLKQCFAFLLHFVLLQGCGMSV